MDQKIDSLQEKLLVYLRNQCENPEINYINPPAQLQGGFETKIYHFQLEGVKGDLARPLVLRLYPKRYGSGNAVWESKVQNALKETGYPVAKAHHLCTDLAVLDGAFFIMDYLPGIPMVMISMEDIPGLLGKIHAELHLLDPVPLVEALHAGGIDTKQLYIQHRYNSFLKQAQEYPWLQAIVDWLMDERPPVPEKLAICHGDFHPLNILVNDGKVSGVLDWPGLLIGDPVIDIANTMVLITIPFKHVAPSLDLDFSGVDFKLVSQRYLKAYEQVNPFPKTHMDYYRVRRCVNALLEGVQGQSVWKFPPIRKDLIDYITTITDVKIQDPLI
jgi:aminoglycoside phosphotransferase (APT) family kinase protein